MKNSIIIIVILYFICAHMSTIDEEFFNLWGDCKWFHQIQELDNELLNIWIRVYYKRYWVEEHPSLSEKWKKDTIDECKLYSAYFDWVKIHDICVPHIKDDLILSNKECSILEHILENYSGLRGFDIGCIIGDCLGNEKETKKYKRTIKKSSKFP